MSKQPQTPPRPSRICLVVGFGIGAVGSFLIAIVLGTGYSFGLVLHFVLAGLAGWMLAQRCTENGDELFGIVGFFYTPQRREQLAEMAGKVTEAAKAGAERVVEATKRLPEQVAGASASRSTAAEEAATAAPSPPAKAPRDIAAPPEAPSSSGGPASAGAAPGRRPPLLDAPRGEPDDLTRINGIGPKLAAMLNEVGIWHFAQIATWTDEELDWLDGHLGAFRGRARRDDWVGQARALTAGSAGPAGPAPRPDSENGPTDRG